MVLFILVCAPISALAQTVVWDVPVYAQLADEAGGAPQQVSFFPSQQRASVTRLSSIDPAGILMIGGAETEETSNGLLALTPYITKSALSDGHLLWSWPTVPYAATNGSFLDTAIFVSGDVIAIGSLYDASTFESLLVKFDGATGDVLWRIDGSSQSEGYAVAIDGEGNVYATIADDINKTQIISKYAGATGSLLWSNSMPDANDFLDDYVLVLDSDGHALAAGLCSVEQSDGSHANSTQIGRFDATDGSLLWRQIVAPSNPQSSPWPAIETFNVMDDCDVLVATDQFRRLRARDGSIAWQQMKDRQFRNVLIGSEDRIYTAAGFLGANNDNAAVARIDPESGATIWETGVSNTAIVTQLTQQSDGNILAGWNTSGSSPELGITSLDADSGSEKWHLNYLEGPLDSYGANITGVFQVSASTIYVTDFETDLPDGGTQTLTKIDNPHGFRTAPSPTPRAHSTGRRSPLTPPPFLR